MSELKLRPPKRRTAAGKTKTPALTLQLAPESVRKTQKARKGQKDPPLKGTRVAHPKKPGADKLRWTAGVALLRETHQKNQGAEKLGWAG